jgi:FkbM family methyltransferase
MSKAHVVIVTENPFISEHVDLYIMELFWRLRIVHHGASVKDKLNLFVWLIFDSFPRILRQLNFTLDRTLQGITNALSKNTLILINKVKYLASASDSLFILSPEFEQDVWKHFKPKRGEIFIDIGAHVGKYTLQVATIVGNEGLVIALEPHPENWQVLLKAISLNKLRNIVVLNVAAWERDCKLNIFIGDESGHHSAKQNRGLGYIEVEARAVDNIVEELNLKRVDWLKIDVEGAELEVLKGLKNTLTKYAPKVIVEVRDENLKAMLEFMENCGYTVMPIKSLRGYFYGEPIFIREHHSARALCPCKKEAYQQ